MDDETRQVLELIVSTRDRLYTELGWHYNPSQPRWPKGSGRKSGQWMDGLSIGSLNEKPKIRSGPRFRPGIGKFTVKTGAPEGSTDPEHLRKRTKFEQAVGKSGYTDPRPPETEGLIAQVMIVTDPKTKKDYVVKSYAEDEGGFDEVENEMRTQVVAEAIGAPIAKAWKLDDDTLVMPKIEGHTGFWYDAKHDYADSPETIAAINSEDGKKLALLDAITSNGDRHVGNFIITPEGKPVGIDHGRTWVGSGADSVFDWDYSNPPYDKEYLTNEIRPKLEALADHPSFSGDNKFFHDQMMEMFWYIEDQDEDFLEAQRIQDEFEEKQARLQSAENKVVAADDAHMKRFFSGKTGIRTDVVNRLIAREKLRSANGQSDNAKEYIRAYMKKLGLIP